MRILAVVLVLIVLAAAPGSAPPATFARLGDDAVATLRRAWYVPGGGWRGCAAPRCGASASDWGADSLTGVLDERWLLTRDAALVPWVHALLALAPDHLHDRGMLSDVPLWDAVSAVRAYDVTRDPGALQLAEDDYAYVANEPSFTRGACAGIDYQYPQRDAGPRAGGGLKTLESDANRVLAAALLAARAGDPRARRAYLADARYRYALIRARFRDPRVGLYTVYAFDTGGACTIVPRRFFASVNGVMISAALALADASGDPRYVREARATARAVRALDDDRGVFADLQAENDVAAPLVFAMVELARRGDAFARAWILRNAAAAAHARRADGSYARFFDGPPPGDGATVTAFQTAGGFALLVAAASFAPGDGPERDDPWPTAARREVDVRVPPSGAFAFVGSGIALVGTLGERCIPAYRGDPMCEGGHAHVLLDGRAMTDRTGIWQGKTLTGAQPGTVLFAWRWPRAARHVLRFVGGEPNAKEGGPYLHLSGATTLP
ncbi:MAG TPA: hypothetical protein VMA36_02395 [Candidatus Limnocylindria bacterium]|nr:hypothetical protein [Candidatus Limnocylindria bacterium]